MLEPPFGWALQAPLVYWNWLTAGWDAGSAAAVDGQDIAERTAHRFGNIVRYARAHSPYYRGLYRELPPENFQPSQVPPATRSSLMARFDEWVTDNEVTLGSLSRFVADPGRVGQPYLGRYAAWSSSGTTGQPGLFVHDAQALATYDALEMRWLARGPLVAELSAALMLSGGRYAMIAATGGHFAGVASIERLRFLAPAIADRARVFSILDPLPRLVKELNAYQPMFVATYPTMASLLAAEQVAGRLAITPAMLWLGGETLTAAYRAQLRRAFHCRLLEEYGASECMSIASECHRGSLHLNSDWVLIEPVDRAYEPVLPGDASHTVLLTNLANRVQPIIRYDLGDSVVLAPEKCACGSPFPTLRVEGRSEDLLRLCDEHGKEVCLPPLAVSTVMEDFAGIHGFQIVQTGPAALSLRLDPIGHDAHPAPWENAVHSMSEYLCAQGLPNVKISRDAAPPERSAHSGKLRRIVSGAFGFRHH